MKYSLVLLSMGVIGCSPVEPVDALVSLGARIARDEQGEVDFVDLNGDLVFDDATGNLLRIESRVTDGGLVHLSGLIHLRELRLSHTRIGDRGLVHLANLIHLEVLQLTATQVSDAGLLHLGGMAQLQTLDLSETNITSAGLAHLVGLTRLQHLDLRDTRITAADIADFRQLLPGCQVRN